MHTNTERNHETTKKTKQKFNTHAKTERNHEAYFFQKKEEKDKTNAHKHKNKP